MALDPPDTLLKKAQDDERVLLLIYRSTQVSDEYVGFCAQQAVEKSIKSILARRGVPYRRTHDLAELIDLLDRDSIAFPVELRTSVSLTPFAAQFRYDDLLESEHSQAPFDRDAVVRLASMAVAWAAGNTTGR